MLSCEVKSQLDFRIAGLDAQRDLRAEMREIVERARALRNERVKRGHDAQGKTKVRRKLLDCVVSTEVEKE